MTHQVILHFNWEMVVLAVAWAAMIPHVKNWPKWADIIVSSGCAVGFTLYMIGVW